jgi:hypothetical protein
MEKEKLSYSIWNANRSSGDQSAGLLQLPEIKCRSPHGRLNSGGHGSCYIETKVKLGNM